MHATLDLPSPTLTHITQTEALRAASRYVAEQLDPAFTVVADRSSAADLADRGRWRFFIVCEHGPLSALFVNAPSGIVVPLTGEERRVVREKAAIYAARKQGVLPVDSCGYVLAEYARRRADSYLGDKIGMYFNATDPVLLQRESPQWQVTIVFKRYALGPFTLGVMDVDARTGEPISLNQAQLSQIRRRAHALIEFHSSSAAA